MWLLAAKGGTGGRRNLRQELARLKIKRWDREPRGKTPYAGLSGIAPPQRGVPRIGSPPGHGLTTRVPRRHGSSTPGLSWPMCHSLPIVASAVTKRYFRPSRDRSGPSPNGHSAEGSAREEV